MRPLMFPAASVVVALCHLGPSLEAPVVVTLRCDVTEVRIGDPVLLKVAAVNRSNTRLVFSPPLTSFHRNLRYECLAPAAEEFRTVGMLDLSNHRSNRFRGWEVATRHVSYDYLLRNRVWHGPISPSPPPRVPQRHMFDAEGDWYVRAAVVAEGTKFYSPPVRIRVRGSHPKPAADALDACAEVLRMRLTLNTLPPREAHVALFAKHLPALEGTPAAVPLRRAVLLDDVVTAKTPEGRAWAAGRVRAFGERCPPLEREYTDLLLGVALVHAKDIPAAQVVLRGLRDERSGLHDHIARGTTPKDDPD